MQKVRVPNYWQRHAHPGWTACRRERRAATQRNLEEAAQRKAEEEKEKAAQRYVRKEYK